MAESWKDQSRVLNGGGDANMNEPTPVKKDIVTMMEKEWPEMTTEFKKLQREQYELFCHKQHDYGPGNISVGTQLQTTEEVRLSLMGLFFRMNDVKLPVPGPISNIILFSIAVTFTIFSKIFLSVRKF